MKRKYVKRKTEINVVLTKEQWEMITRNPNCLTIRNTDKDFGKELFCNNWRKMHHLSLIRRR